MRNRSDFRMSLLAFLTGLSLATSFRSLTAEPGSVAKTIYPVEMDAPLNNPNMGWGLWAGPRYFDGRPFTLEYNTTGFGDEAPLFSWVLIDWMWADLEPQEDKYYWKDLDTIIITGERGGSRFTCEFGSPTILVGTALQVTRYVRSGFGHPGPLIENMSGRASPRSANLTISTLLMRESICPKSKSS